MHPVHRHKTEALMNIADAWKEMHSEYSFDARTLHWLVISCNTFSQSDCYPSFSFARFLCACRISACPIHVSRYSIRCIHPYSLWLEHWTLNTVLLLLFFISFVVMFPKRFLWLFFIIIFECSLAQMCRMHTYCRARNISEHQTWYYTVDTDCYVVGRQIQAEKHVHFVGFWRTFYYWVFVVHSVDQAAFVIWLYGLICIFFSFRNICFSLLSIPFASTSMRRTIIIIIGLWCKRDGGKINIKQWLEIVPRNVINKFRSFCVVQYTVMKKRESKGETKRERD